MFSSVKSLYNTMRTDTNFKRGVIPVILCLFVAACNSGNGNAPVQPDAPVRPAPQKPGEDEPPEFESPLVYNWYYERPFGEGEVSPLPLCPEDFVLDGICSPHLFKCQRGQGLYACYPKDLEVRLTGKVIDEAGLPVRGAHIYSMYPRDYLQSAWQAESKASGNFLVKVNNGCIPMLSVAKDGYVSLQGFAHDLRATRCRVDNFKGSQNLVYQLKRAPRTVESDAPAVSTNEACVIKGRVVDLLGQGVPEVKVENGSATTYTDAAGFYIIDRAERCERFCKAKKRGYARPGPDPADPAWQTYPTAIASCLAAQPADMVMMRK